MIKFDVAVRAIFVATRVEADAPHEVEGWEIFDFDPLHLNSAGTVDQVCVGCDQNVRVTARDEDEAMHIARNSALPIVMRGWNVEFISIIIEKDVDVARVPACVDSYTMAA